MPLAPLHSDSIRPPDGAIRWRLLGCATTRLQRPSVGWVTRSLPTDFVGKIRYRLQRGLWWKMLRSFPPYQALRRLTCFVAVAVQKLQTTRTRSPSEGRAQVLRRGTRGMDAERGAMGHGCPFATTPERRRREGSFAKQNPDAGGGLLFGYFFLATQEKVTRPAGRNQCLSHPANRGNPRTRILAHRTTRQRRMPHSAGRMESLRSGRAAWIP
jgi:hypothetical protein